MRKRRPTIFNQKGQSELLGLIIASAIGAIVIAATTTSFVELQKGQQNVGKTADALDIKRDIEALLTDPVACRENFLGQDGDGHSFTVGLKAADGSIRYPINQIIPGFNVRIESWNLQDSFMIKTTPPVEQLMTLTVLVDKGNEVGGPRTISRTIKLWTERTGAAGTNIANCRAVAGSSSDIWLRHPNDNDIYNANDDSEVLIGAQTIPLVAPTPPANTRLYVLGPNQAASNMNATADITARVYEARGNFTQTGSANNAVLNRLGVGTDTPIEAFDVNGNLHGIGNLTIAGALNGADLLSPNSASVGTDLTVGGSSTLASVNVRGNSIYSSTSQFDSDLQVDGPSIMQTTLQVLGGSIGSNALRVGGSMVTTDLVTATRVNSQQFCIGSNCRTTFATQTCPPGQVAYQNNVDGTILCSTVSCPAGSFFRGMTGPNTEICSPLPTASCPVGTYISGYTADNAGGGSYSCTPIPPQYDVASCPSGYLYAVSAGIAQCAPLALIGGDCGPGTAAVSIDADGRPTCQPVFQNALTCSSGQIQTGMLADGTPVCNNLAVASNCSSDGQVLSSISSSPNRTGVCGSVSIVGGSCPNGVKSISSSGAVTCL